MSMLNMEIIVFMMRRARTTCIAAWGDKLIPPQLYRTLYDTPPKIMQKIIEAKGGSGSWAHESLKMALRGEYTNY